MSQIIRILAVGLGAVLDLVVDGGSTVGLVEVVVVVTNSLDGGTVV